MMNFNGFNFCIKLNHCDSGNKNTLKIQHEFLIRYKSIRYLLLLLFKTNNPYALFQSKENVRFNLKTKIINIFTHLQNASTPFCSFFFFLLSLQNKLLRLVGIWLFREELSYVYSFFFFFFLPFYGVVLQSERINLSVYILQQC